MSRPPTTDLPEPLLRAHRRRAIRAAALGIAGLAAVAGLFATILVAQLLGVRSWQQGDPAAAGGYFAVNRQLNLVEPWIAPFNAGVAAHGRGRWLEAAGFYEEAWPLAPQQARCRVVLNWSWALESAGDESERTGHRDLAQQHWAAAREALSRAGDCDDGRDGGSSNQETKAPEQPSPTSIPSPPPSLTPTASPTEPGEGDQPPPQSEPQPGSEQDQVDRTRQRIDQKVGIPSGDSADEPGQDEERQSDQLDERNQQAAEERQRKLDEQRRTSAEPPVRSW